MLKSWLPTLRRRSEEAMRPVSIADIMEDFWQRPFGVFPLMEDFQKSFFGKGEAFPAVNVSQTEKEIAVDAELPWLETKDVDVSLENDVLVINGRRNSRARRRRTTTTASSAATASSRGPCPCWPR